MKTAPALRRALVWAPILTVGILSAAASAWVGDPLRGLVSLGILAAGWAILGGDS